MKTLFLLTLLCFSLLSTPPTFAAKNALKCEKSATIKKTSQCLDSVIEKVDRDLQTWVNNQTFNLEDLALKTGRSAALAMFKRSQNDFIKYRADNCRWLYLAVSPNITASLAFKKCYIILSRNRINELKQFAAIK